MNFTFEQAEEIEKQLFDSISHLDDSFITVTQTFKPSLDLHRQDRSLERMKKVGSNIRKTCAHKDFRIRMNKLPFLIKDELSNDGLGHCHTIIWTEEILKKGININYFRNVMNGLWSAPFEEYNHSKWDRLENNIIAPTVGYLKTDLPYAGTEKTLLRYQTKFTYGSKVVGVAYHPSEGLKSKVDSLKELDCILQRN